MGWITAEEVENLRLPQLVGFEIYGSKSPTCGVGFCWGRRPVQPEIQQSCGAERGRLIPHLNNSNHFSGRKKIWDFLTLNPFGLFVPFLV